MLKNKVSKLGNDDYIKTDKSYTDKLTDNTILDKLKNYVEVQDVGTLPLRTHVRYFSYNPKTKSHQFRLGGFIRKNDDPRYVILATAPFGGKTWSVQRVINNRDTVFFKSNNEVVKPGRKKGSVSLNKAPRSKKKKDEEIKELYEQTRLELIECKKELNNLKY